MIPGIRPNIAKMKPYPPGKPIADVQRELGLSKVIKLASNENPLGPSPLAIVAMQEAVSGVNLYPDAGGYALKQAIAAKFGKSTDSLLLGSGSDDIISVLGTMFLEPGTELIMGDPSFIRYVAAAELADATLVRVPLSAEWKHDLFGMASKFTDRTRLVFIANPNNPTGTIVGRQEVQAFLQDVPPHVTVVFDEAYFEFAGHDPDYPNGLEFLEEGHNVVVLRTMSKAYGLAGSRVGFGFAKPDLVAVFNAVRAPFAVNSIGQAGAVAALADESHLQEVLASNHSLRSKLIASMQRLGYETIPSHANFVCIDVRRPSTVVFADLMREGVIVRPGEQLGMPTFIRVSIGTEEEMDKFHHAFLKVVANGAVAQ